jgi:hypothetical protein
MNTLELFSGTKSFSKVMAMNNHDTLTIDNDNSLNPDSCKDILEYIDYTPYDVIWASPPCTAFSVASIGKNWRNGFPISPNAALGLRLLERTILIIAVNNPKVWYIENPRGMMRKVIDSLFKKYNIKNYRRVTISYCQYGDTRMKPTDIWTNDFNWIPKAICKPKSSCHESAPRGSRTGTQGLKGSKDRSMIPYQLGLEIRNTIIKNS